MDTLVLFAVGAWLLLMAPAVAAPFLVGPERSPSPPERRELAPPTFPPAASRGGQADEAAAA